MSSTRVAEMAKLLENIHRDIHEVIRAAATKPLGFVASRAGAGRHAARGHAAY